MKETFNFDPLGALSFIPSNPHLFVSDGSSECIYPKPPEKNNSNSEQ